jgi:hypothetical protein
MSSLSRLDNNTLFHAFGFLDDQDLSKSEGVCRSWCKLIQAPDQRLWVLMCQKSSILVNPSDKTVNYKSLACIPRGKLSLNSGSFLMTSRSPNLRGGKWGNNGCEPCIMVSIINSRLLKLQFPQWIPYRLLIKKDGTHKQHRDEVRLNYMGQRVILTCTQDPHASNDFQSTLDFCGVMSLSIICPGISSATLAASKALAQKETQEWISSD